MVFWHAWIKEKTSVVSTHPVDNGCRMPWNSPFIWNILHRSAAFTLSNTPLKQTRCMYIYVLHFCSGFITLIPFFRICTLLEYVRWLCIWDVYVKFDCVTACLISLWPVIVSLIVTITFWLSVCYVNSYPICL